MAKKIELTKEQLELFNELKTLAKTANQRLLRIERLTGSQGLFASKQLYDYLDSSTLQALSEKGRVRVSKSFSTTQMLAIKKATEQFLENKEVSTVSGIKKLTKSYSEKAGKTLSYEQADTLYQTGKNYRWIIGMNGLTESEFWGTWVPLAKRGELEKDDWIEQLSLRINVELDEYYKSKLEAIYYYVTGD